MSLYQVVVRLVEGFHRNHEAEVQQAWYMHDSGIEGFGNRLPDLK